MTVPIQTPVASYTGNGVATQYSAPFRVLTAADLIVEIDGVATSVYTLSGIGDDEATVTFQTAPASGTSILIYRAVALERTTDYQFNGDLLANTVNGDFDRIWMALQDVAAYRSRSIQYPVSEYGIDGTLPLAGARANMVLGFDANGFQEMLPMPSSLGAGDIRFDTFTAVTDFTSDVTTQLTLSRAPISKGNCWAYWDGVPQLDFTLAGNVITFPTPIPTGISKVYVRIGTTLSVGTPAQQSVTDDSLAPGSKIYNRVNYQFNVKDFGVVGDGVTDDTSAISNAINFVASHGGGEIEFPAGTFVISSALPPLSTTGIRLIGVGAGGDNGLATGTVLKATGSPGYTMVTMTSIIGQRKATHMALKGIFLDCNSVASEGLRMLSVDFCDVDVKGKNARTQGTYFGCVAGALATDPQDLQRNRISVYWVQTAIDVPCFVAQNGATGNPSFNVFPFLYLVNLAGVQPAAVWIGTDNNTYQDVALGSGGTYAGIFNSSNAAPNFGSNNELFIKVSGSKPVYVQGGGTYSNPKMIRVIEYDMSNGTPAWVADTGTSLIDPMWRQYFPTLTYTGGGGGVTGVTAQYRRASPTSVDFKCTFSVTVAGGSGAVQIPLIVGRSGVAADTVAGQEVSASGKAVTGNIPAGTTTARMQMYDASAIPNGSTVVVSGSYQCSYQDVLI